VSQSDPMNFLTLAVMSAISAGVRSRPSTSAFELIEFWIISSSVSAGAEDLETAGAAVLGAFVGAAGFATEAASGASPVAALKTLW